MKYIAERMGKKLWLVPEAEFDNRFVLNQEYSGATAEDFRVAVKKLNDTAATGTTAELTEQESQAIYYAATNPMTIML